MTSATANEATPHNPFIGKVMGGRYQVDRLIGRGGMGLVYLGRELLEDRELVLKMLAPHWADDPGAVGRFEREGKRLGELRHPNIVELFDIGHESDHPYIVMEFIRGIPLRKVLNGKGRLTPAEFFPIAAQLLEAVSYAHGKGVMLRDIKPSNVMLCEQGGKANFVKVLDFGLAKMVDGDDVEITKSNVIGTAGFLAPELIRGGEIDVRVDVYALAIMFFIMLTGSSPILGENDGAILYNHVHGQPRAFEDALPAGAEVPKGLQDLVYKAMAKDAGDRHANAGEMLDELRTLADADAFELPDISAEGKAEVERYWDRKFEGLGLSDDDPSSSLWTRPRLQKLLEGDVDDAADVAASNEDPYGTSPGASKSELESGAEGEGPDVVLPEPGAPRLMPPQPSAAIRARTSGRSKTAPTRMGLPSVASEGSEPPVPPPDVRRPKPARTVASSNMERALPGPPPRRKTLQGPPEPASKPPKRAGPTAKGKTTQPPIRSVAPVSMMAPQPLEAPSPLEGDNDVGPLHLELQAPPRRKPKVREPGSRSTLPMGSSLGKPAANELDVMEMDELEIEIEDDADLEPAVVDLPDTSEPITDPVAPVTRPARDLSSEAVPPMLSEQPGMAEAEPVPAKRGIGMVLALSVGAALLLGGVVTWMALRPDSDAADAVVAADDASPAGANGSAAQDAEAEPNPDAEPAVEVDADLDANIDPDAPGTIRVEGPDGAEAFINDESVGTVPAKVSRPPGLYKIRVEARGFEDWSTEVQLQPDGLAKLVAANAAKAGGGAKPSAPRRKPSGGSKPSKPDNTSPEPKPEPKAEPPAKKPPPEDDVFMKRGEKKDDGIFLPVGK